MLEHCIICGHRCGVNRLAGQIGVCAAGPDAKVSSHFPHHGEEPPVSGVNGSGTIFFSECSMKCAYCQNYPISQQRKGVEVSVEQLAGMMLELQDKGCHNINLVTPTHYAPPIISAIEKARDLGLDVPVVYNSGGYDSEELVGALNGLVDIYLVDMRYSSDKMAFKYSRAVKYVEVNRTAVASMFKQVGNLVQNNEIAVKGMIIRLLILPNAISGVLDTLDFIHDNLGSDMHLSMMSQYYPAWHAKDMPELARRISKQEYEAVVDKLAELEMSNGWLQPFEGGDTDKFAGEKILTKND